MTIHGVEYDVLFDGVHGGQDWDLLCCEAIPEKREHVPVDDRAVVIQQRRAARPLRLGALAEAVLEHIEDEPHTTDELAAMTGLNVRSVGNVLTRLRHHGKVMVVGKSPLKKGMGRWPLLYEASE